VDLPWRHVEAYFCLLFGGALAIWAIVGLVKHKGSVRVGWLIQLALGATFVAVGLLYLLGLVASVWFDGSRNAVSGIFFMMVGANWLSTRPTDRAASWLFLVVGEGCILAAVYSGLTTLWS
jgi:hypothetical protein